MDFVLELRGAYVFGGAAADKSGTEDEEIRGPAATIGILRPLDVQGRLDELIWCVGAGDFAQLETIERSEFEILVLHQVFGHRNVERVGYGRAGVRSRRASLDGRRD